MCVYILLLQQIRNGSMRSTQMIKSNSNNINATELWYMTNNVFLSLFFFVYSIWSQMPSLPKFDTCGEVPRPFRFRWQEHLSCNRWRLNQFCCCGWLVCCVAMRLNVHSVFVWTWKMVCVGSSNMIISTKAHTYELMDFVDKIDLKPY